MTFPRLARAALVAAVLAAPLAVAPAASAAGDVTLQAEAMTVLSGRAPVYTGTDLSGGQARRLATNATVSGSVTTPASDRLALRLRGDQFQGAPQAVVKVDGVRLAQVSVPATSWSTYVIPGSFAAGPHRVDVSFVNDYAVSGVGDRNLHVDAVTFRAAATTTPTPPTPPTPPTTGTTDAFEARLVELVNIERGKAGLAPLAVSPCATTFAEDWSATMARTGVFEHRSDLRAVMSTCGASGVGENIAYGSVTADQMMAMWMGSTGHRANILNPRYTHIGVGAATTSSGRVYGTQNFLTI